MLELDALFNGLTLLIAGASLGLVGYIGRRLIARIDKLEETINDVRVELSRIQGVVYGTPSGPGRGPRGSFTGRA